MADDDKDILAEARRRLKQAQDREAYCRPLMDADIKFGNGDSDNHYQWPDDPYNERDGAGLPCLTINKTRQHCLHIVNDMRQNKPGVQVRPVGGGASFDAAQVFEGIVRHIEYVSNAQQAYDTAAYSQVFGGLGWWRIVTDWADDESRDQEIFIKRVPNWKSIYLDPNIQEYDGSDADWGFVIEELSRDEAEAQGLVDKDETVGPALAEYDNDGWNDKDHVRIAEYFRRGRKTDELIEIPDDIAAAIGVISGTLIKKSDLPPELYKALPKTAWRRPIAKYPVEWIKIVGDKVKERREWPGKYIPLIRCVGEETVINGILDRKGHVRALKDPQRMYNYNSSASVQYGALQSKTPYVAAIEAIEEYQGMWKDANIKNYSVLVHKAYAADGQPLPTPQRQQPPASAPVFLEGMKVAEQELMLASGQYQAIMGSPSNETSGKAINARQRQGDNATYHYIDHQASAIRYCGKQLIDLIPKIYDTPRVVQIIAQDGTRQSVQIDPNAPQAHQPTQDPGDPGDAKIAAIFNPSVGKYDVMADVGPSYATARQEAFNAYSQIIASNHDLVHVVGDLMFMNADFPGADKIAERLRRMVPPEATGGPSKEMQALQAHVQQAAQAGQQQIEQLHAALQQAKTELDDKTAKDSLELYRAETERLKVVGGIDPAALQPVIRGMVSDVIGMHIVPIMQAHAAATAPPQPMQGPTQGQGEPDADNGAQGASGGAPEPDADNGGGLPPQAAQHLAPGHVTTFGNGQKWTVQNGQPQRVG